MQRLIILIFLLAIVVLPALAISSDMLTAFWQFQRAIYYAKDLSSIYPFVSTLEVQSLKRVVDPKTREKKLDYYRSQYLEDPVFTAEERVPEGIRISGTGIALIDLKRHRGHFHYIFKNENGRWVSWSRQFVSDPS